MFRVTPRPAPKAQARRLVVAIALVLLVTTVTACQPGANDGSEPPGAKNLIIILSDTHRLDHVSGLSPRSRPLTPNLERLIRLGTSFENATTPVPISAPAYASLLTGLRPVEHGLLNNAQHLDGQPVLLQERLRAAGYTTSAVVSNPFCSAAHGFGRGFDDFWDGIEGRGKEGEIVTTEAVKRLDSLVGEQPFFLFTAYMDAHVPYIADDIPPSLRLEVNGVWIRDELAENAHIEQRYPVTLRGGDNTINLSFLDGGRPAAPITSPSPLHVKELRLESGADLIRAIGVEEVQGTGFERLANRTELRVTIASEAPIEDEIVFRCYRDYRPENIPSLYESGVRSFDRSFGRLLDAIEDRGLLADTVVVFVSDHGEMLGEHDAWGHVEHLHQETLRVPLVIAVPGSDGEMHDRTPLDLCDLHDLVLELTLGDRAGLRKPPETKPEPLLVAATYPPESPVLQAAAIRLPFKVVVAADGSERAFDLEDDPGEHTDILQSRSGDPTLTVLLEAARAELAAAGSARSLDPEDLSPEERDRLRALGYLEPGG